MKEEKPVHPALAQYLLDSMPSSISEEQPSAGVVTRTRNIQVCKLGRLGAAFDAPDIHYAYTYTEQPDNVGAMKLGRAAAINATGKHGDEIDRGLHLLLQLQAEGFGVFQIAAAPTPSASDAVPVPVAKINEWADKLNSSDGNGYGWEDNMAEELRALLATGGRDE